MRRRLVSTLALSLLLGACDLINEPVETLRDLEALGVGTNAIRASDGFVTPVAFFANVSAAPIIGRDQQVLVTLETARGDREVVGLRRFDCRLADDLLAVCNEMLIALKPGATPDHLRYAANEIGIGLRWDPVLPTFVVGRAFGNWTLGMQALRTHPAVAQVEFNQFASVLDASLVGFGSSRVEGALRTDRGKPTRNDGRLSIAAGDVVTVTYRQPDGSTISAATVVQ